MKRRRRVVGVLALLGLVVGATACGPPPIAGQGYEVVFEDQFDYTTQAAMGDVWELHAPFSPAPGTQGITFHTDPADPANRFVRLTTGQFRNWNWSYISTTGARRSSPEPNYPDAQAWRTGYFEARVRYTSNQWSWPAFWLFSMAKMETWPQTGSAVCPPHRPLISEFDILDSGRWDAAHAWHTDHYHGAVHSNTPVDLDGDGDGDPWCGVANTQLTYGEGPLDGIDLTQWHVWSGRWTENADGSGEMCTYMDDIEIGCHPTFPSARQPMAINFDINHNGHLNPAGGGRPPAGTPDLSLDIDWVRVWQLPDSPT